MQIIEEKLFLDRSHLREWSIYEISGWNHISCHTYAVTERTQKLLMCRLA